MTPRKQEPYGAAISIKRHRGHLVATMPWPRPCLICRKAARWEVDGRRLCREHLQEAVRK